MKTTILKWDYYLQVLLGIANLGVIAMAWAIPYLLLFAQLLIGFYQLCSSGLHLVLQHKSLGFVYWRFWHFTGSLIYLVFLGALVYAGVLNTVVFVFFFMIVPQVILYSYIWLCKKELNWLERNEFHILK
jgi:hypothetical protein